MLLGKVGLDVTFEGNKRRRKSNFWRQIVAMLTTSSVSIIRKNKNVMFHTQPHENGRYMSCQLAEGRPSSVSNQTTCNVT